MSAPGQVEAPLVGAPDVADLPGTRPDDRALEVAGAQIRSECGWHIAPRVSMTVTVDSDGSVELMLPTLALRDVAGVRDARGRTVTGWSWSSAGILHRTGGWPRGPRAVTATISHGYDEAPLELVALAAALARGHASLVEPGQTSEAKTVGGISTTRAFRGDGTVAATLTAWDHVLARYRIRVPA